MTNVIRILGAAAALAAVQHVSAAAESFTTAGGLRIDLRPPEQMSCAALRRKMGEIDATGYRGLAPPPVPPEDRRLFEYETAVSNRYYSTCGADDEGRESVGLRGGFRAEDADE